MRLIRPIMASKLATTAAFLWLTLTASLRADWAWKSDHATPTLSEDHLVAVFAFHNNGTKPVKVKELMFSCSCTEFTFTATAAEPGRDGELRILVSAAKKETALEFVAFGSEQTTPTQMTIDASTPVKLVP
jgi:hypothetical protein